MSFEVKIILKTVHIEDPSGAGLTIDICQSLCSGRICVCSLESANQINGVPGTESQSHILIYD